MLSLEKGSSVIFPFVPLLSQTGESKFAYSALKDGKKKIPVLSPQQNKELQTFYKKTMKGCKTLQNKALNLPATNYRQMLQEIAEAQRFEVSYMDLPENNVSGELFIEY